MSLVIRNIEQLFQQNGLLPTDVLIFRRPTATGPRKEYKITVADFVSIIRGDSGSSDSEFLPTDDTFDSDFTVVLASGKSFGKFVNGDIVPASGKTAKEVILLANNEYINPAFSGGLGVTGQATTVEVGTTLTGSKTFTWTIILNSGTVLTVDIFDVTANSTLLANTPNDGSQSTAIATIQLNANGSTQQWRAILHDTGQVPNLDIPSSIFTVTSRYFRFYGPTASSPTNSAQVRALASSAFHTGATTFNLLTGTTQTKFVVALPPGVTISAVIDLDASNAPLTSEYVLIGTVNVLDTGGTNRAYNIYEMNVGVAYSTSHRHQITTAN